MHKLTAILALSCATVYSFASTTIAGSYAWVSGTLAATVTPSNTPQTVKVTVGTTTITIPTTLVIGATTSPIPAGNTFTVLKAGSTPFAGTFAGTSLEAFTNADVANRADHRFVPMSTAGALTDSVGFVTFGNNSALSLFFPPFSVGSYSFPNGMVEYISVPLTHFAVTLPTSVSPASGSITFPSGSSPMNLFRLTCLGGTQMDLGGQSTSGVVTVSGPIISATPNFTAAVLRIQNSVLE